MRAVIPQTVGPTDSVVAHSVEQAARRLGVGKTTIYELLQNGELRAFRIGTRRLISDDALREFVAARERAA